LAIAASGSFTAFEALQPNPWNIVDSSYGRTLLLKLAIAAAAGLAAGYNRFWLMRRLDDAPARLALRNNVACEILVLAVVLGCSVILAGTPPAH
jgi:putative copper export protein